MAFVRSRLRAQLQRKGASPAEVEIADEVLDPDRLTLGFARRFATYKRGTLLFRDPERLIRILNHPERPVQIIYAGKAHPADDHGKDFIRQIAHFCKREEFRHHLVFVEDYDMNVARYLVQGVDVWLNTPRRPLEASGTSGMKAAVNGVLNLSVLDGWWCEGYETDAGWAIGSGEDYDDAAYQDRVEGEALYEILEKDIVPCFYNRGRDDLPREWIHRMKRTLISTCPVFNTNRMVRNYSERFYFPCLEQFGKMNAEMGLQARSLAAWKKRVLEDWADVRILRVVTDGETPTLRVGDLVPIRVEVDLGSLPPEDVAVEAYYGRLDSMDEIVEPSVMRLDFASRSDGGPAVYEGKIECTTSGRFGFAPRVLASHADLPVPDRLAMLTWG